MTMNEVMLLGLINVSIPVFAAIVAIWYILESIAYTKLFPKTGRKSSHAWIPVLNHLERFDIAWSKGAGAVSLISGILSIVLVTYVTNAGRPASLNMLLVIGYLMLLVFAMTSIIGLYKLSLAFEHGAFFALGLIFFCPIFLLILGFGKSEFWGEIK